MSRSNESPCHVADCPWMSVIRLTFSDDATVVHACTHHKGAALAMVGAVGGYRMQKRLAGGGWSE